MAPVYHIVLCSFREDISKEAVTKICDGFLEMQDVCLHPETHRPYVKLCKGGKDSSIVPFSNGLTHGWVMEFASPADRDYYMTADPIHSEFKEAFGKAVDKRTVFDFTPGDW